MKTKSILILLGLATTGLPGFAAQIDLTKLPPASGKSGLTYAKDIRPLLEASCFRCHSGERPRADLRLDSLQDLLAGGNHGQVVVAGKSGESRLLIAVAQLDDETAMPPKRGPGPGGPGGPGGQGGPTRGQFGGPDGGPPPGGPGGADRPQVVGGPGNILAHQMVLQADKGSDGKLSQEEFTALADAWFDKLDTEKAGKLSQQQFTAKFSELLPSRTGPGGGGPLVDGPPGAGPQRGGGRDPSRFLGQALFAAADADKDGSLTRVELKSTFAKWFAAWDTDKSGSLDESKLRAGLNTVLPRPNFGGPGGPGGPRGPDGPRNQGPPPAPLTTEQVGLVRGWIDQGAN
jgi:hypothetical protein